MTNENGNMFMPVVPQGYAGNNGNDMFGGNWMWFLLVWMAMFGWGNGGFGFGNNGGTAGDIQRGFDQSALTTGINNIQQALCGGFAGVNQGVANGFAQAEIAANSRQMADMNQQFALQSALQNCCCENRAATADLKYALANESAAIRANCDANNQKILDKLCQLELEGVKQNYEGQIRALQNQLSAQALENQSLRDAALSSAQTAAIQAGQRTLANEIEQYVLPTPRPAYVVQNPNCCPQYGYSCGAA